MLCYVIFGGMLATTWVQIIKAVLLMAGILVMSVFVLERVGFNPIELFNKAEANSTDGVDVLARARARSYVADRHRVARPGARARHGRPAAHPDALLHRPERQGRARVGRLGDVPDRRLLPDDHVPRLRRARGAGRGRRRGGRHRRQPGGAEPGAELGGGDGTFGGDMFLAVIAGVAFATILAVVAGLVLSASGAVAHDIWSSIIRKGKDSEHEEVWVAKIAAAAIGAIAILIAVIGGEGLNVSFMVGLAFAIAASANFPALLLALTWRRFNTTGAVCGVLLGVVSAIFLIIVSPKVWPGADTESGSPIGWTLANPGIISIPLGFLGCFLGTLLSTRAGGGALLPRALRAVRDRARGREGAACTTRVRARDDRRRRRTWRTARRSTRSSSSCSNRRPSRPRRSSGSRRSSRTRRSTTRPRRDPEGFWASRPRRWTGTQQWDQVLDGSNPPFSKWFAGGKLNVSYNCLDRHVEAGHGDRVAFHWRGEEGEERDVTYADAARRRAAVRQRAEGPRHRRRRRRRDLPADDPRGRRRDARLRAHRRAPQRRLRRLQRRVGQGADGVLRGQGADHRRRRAAQGQDGADQAAGRRGDGREPRPCVVVRHTGADAPMADKDALVPTS